MTWPGATRYCLPPVPQRLRVLTQLVEPGRDRVHGDLVALALPAPQLLIGRVGGDAVDPAAEGRLPLEGVDLPGRGPERVLHHFLGVLLVAGDADGQPVDAVAVGRDQRLGSARVLPAQTLDQLRVPIHLPRAARVLLVS